MKELFEAITPQMPYYHLSRRVAEVAMRHPLQFLLLTILVYGSLGYGGHTLYRLEKEKQEAQRQIDLSYAKQLENLNETESNLKSLIQYVANQKVKLRESQDVIEQLESEHARLQPIIAADKEIVDAIFGAQEVRQQKDRRIGYLVSFALGVLSSLTATFIAYVVVLSRQKKKEEATA